MKSEYRCNYCLEGFLCHVTYEIFPNGMIISRQSNVCTTIKQKEMSEFDED